LAITHSSFDGQVVNVANGRQITVAQVADTVRQVMSTDKEIRFNGEERKGDPINWEADISVIKSWGYEPSVELEDGVKSYIKWIKDLA
jgi:dTDP-glucose 4,6-dehydratase/UDP-glucose 4-epimerase